MLKSQKGQNYETTNTWVSRHFPLFLGDTMYSLAQQRKAGHQTYRVLKGLG